MNIEKRQNWKGIRDFLVVAGGMGVLAILSYVAENLADLGLTPTWIAIVSPVIAMVSLWIHRFVRPS